MKKHVLLAMAAAIALAGLGACTTTVTTGGSSASTLWGVLPDPIKTQATKDLLATAANMDAAVQIGLIPAGDPLATCPHQFNQLIGIEVAPGGVLPPTLTANLQVAGVVSAGSVAYLKALQLMQVKQQGIQIPAVCAQAFGEIQMQGWGTVFNVAGGIPITFTTPPAPAPVPAAKLVSVCPPAYHWVNHGHRGKCEAN